MSGGTSWGEAGTACQKMLWWTVPKQGFSFLGGLPFGKYIVMIKVKNNMLVMLIYAKVETSEHEEQFLKLR